MEIKYYKAGIAARSLTSKARQNMSVSTIQWKTMAGDIANGMTWATNSSFANNAFNNATLFSIKSISASSDDVFNIEEYSPQNIVGVSTIQQVEGVTGRTYRISVFNNSNTEITVNSFKAIKYMANNTYSDQGVFGDTLVFWIKLDSAATIAAGETKDFVIDINFLNE